MGDNSVVGSFCQVSSLKMATVPAVSGVSSLWLIGGIGYNITTIDYP